MSFEISASAPHPIRSPHHGLSQLAKQVHRLAEGLFAFVPAAQELAKAVIAPPRESYIPCSVTIDVEDVECAPYDCFKNICTFDARTGLFCWCG